MNCNDAVSLTRKLINFNNCDGNEAGIAGYVGELLAAHGFAVSSPRLSAGRPNVIAEKGISPSAAPIVFSGHFDTVPLGKNNWTVDPFAGKISEGKVYGRGSSDMKSGVAAMVCAAIEAFDEANPVRGVRLVLTASEESGCQGVRFLADSDYDLGSASLVIVGEPTANIPALGHKGGLFVNARTSGVTAHSSMPELGSNAIYKAARAITKIEELQFEVPKDPLLGFPSVNVGLIHGGMNPNSVPDESSFTIDVRTTTRLPNIEALRTLRNVLGEEVILEQFVNLGPVFTDPADPLIHRLFKACGYEKFLTETPPSLPYLTDGSVLQTVYGNVPTIILGPGQPEMAHQTDEFCYTEKIKQAADFYKKIILQQEK